MHDVFRFSQMFISLLENQTDAFCINRDALNSQVVCSKEVTEKVLHAILTFSIQIIQGMCLTKQTNLVCRGKNTNISVLLSFSLPFKVQIRNDLRMDTFAELPVSLVLLSLICIDIVERIRYCRLTGRGECECDLWSIP